MTKNKNEDVRKADYKWASAALSLISSGSSDLRQLVVAAELDPDSGDLSDVDVSGLDLSGQDLSGWDLRYANFKDTKLVGTELRGSIIDPFALIEADGWEMAKIDDQLREGARRAKVLMKLVSELELSVRTDNALASAGMVPLEILYRVPKVNC
jgi:uncharacterized protein YjbI with pentapeptide repeats